MSSHNKSDFIISVIKGTGLAVVCSLLGVLAFAVVVKFAYLSGTAVKSVNQFIKIVSVFIGCFFFLKQNNGLIKGLLIGACSTVITYLIFAIFSGGAVFSLSFLLDILFCAAIGAVSGIIAVNTRGKE